MNTKLHNANARLNEARKAMHEASSALTHAINSDGYGTTAYRVVVAAARDEYSEACRTYDEARDLYDIAAEAPFYTIALFNGTTTVTEAYDDLDELLAAMMDGAEALVSGVDAGTWAKNSTLTVITPSGGRVVWERGRLVEIVR